MAVDEDVLAAGRGAAWVVVGCVVGDAAGTQSAEVGGHAGGAPAPLPEDASIGLPPHSAAKGGVAGQPVGVVASGAMSSAALSRRRRAARVAAVRGRR